MNNSYDQQELMKAFRQGGFDPGAVAGVLERRGTEKAKQLIRSGDWYFRDCHGTATLGNGSNPAVDRVRSFEDAGEKTRATAKKSPLSVRGLLAKRKLRSLPEGGLLCWMTGMTSSRSRSCASC